MEVSPWEQGITQPGIQTGQQALVKGLCTNTNLILYYCVVLVCSVGQSEIGQIGKIGVFIDTACTKQ